MLDLAEHIPRLEAQDYLQCRHETLDRDHKRDLVRCRKCGQSFVRAEKQRRLVAELAKLYLAGTPLRIAAHLTHCSPATVTTWFGRFQRFGKGAKCECGRDRRHGGRCRARRQKRMELFPDVVRRGPGDAQDPRRKIAARTET